MLLGNAIKSAKLTPDQKAEKLPVNATPSQVAKRTWHYKGD